MSRIKSSVGVAAAAVLLLAGCTSASTTNPTEGEKIGTGESLGLVVHFQGPYTSAIAAGARAAAEDVGADLAVYGPTQLDPTAAIADYQNAVSAGAAGMLVVGFPPDLYKSPVDKATALGVVTASVDVNVAPGSTATAHVSSPKAAMGAAVAEAYIAALPEDATGELVPGLCVPGLPDLTVPLDGFRQTMEAARPGVTILEPEVTSADPAENFTAWQRIIAKYPDALGFVGLCDFDVPNLIKAKSAIPGADFLIGVTTGGDDPAAVAQITGGTMVAAIEQNAWLMGYVGMKLVAQAAFADQPLPTGWINTGFTLVSKDNAEYIVELLNDPTVAEAEFKEIGDQIVADAANLAIAPVTSYVDVKYIDDVGPIPAN